MTAFCVLTSDGRAQNEVVLSYVTFYGFDDNDDGNPTHLGTDVISHASVHDRQMKISVPMSDQGRWQQTSAF